MHWPDKTLSYNISRKSFQSLTTNVPNIQKQSIDLQSKSIDQFLYEENICHECLLSRKTVLCKIFCDALRNLVSFSQLKKHQKHPLRSVTLLKVTLFHGCFSRCLNCTNGTKLNKNTTFNPLMSGGIKRLHILNTHTCRFV